MKTGPTFEETIGYLHKTQYGEVLVKELEDRRESYLHDIAKAQKRADLWKAAGAVAAIDELREMFQIVADE